MRVFAVLISVVFAGCSGGLNPLLIGGSQFDLQNNFAIVGPETNLTTFQGTLEGGVGSGGDESSDAYVPVWDGHRSRGKVYRVGADGSISELPTNIDLDGRVVKQIEVSSDGQIFCMSVGAPSDAPQIVYQIYCRFGEDAPEIFRSDYPDPNHYYHLPRPSPLMVRARLAVGPKNIAAYSEHELWLMGENHRNQLGGSWPETRSWVPFELANHRFVKVGIVDEIIVVGTNLGWFETSGRRSHRIGGIRNFNYDPEEGLLTVWTQVFRKVLRWAEDEAKFIEESAENLFIHTYPNFSVTLNFHLLEVATHEGAEVLKTRYGSQTNLFLRSPDGDYREIEAYGDAELREVAHLTATANGVFFVARTPRIVGGFHAGGQFNAGGITILEGGLFFVDPRDPELLAYLVKKERNVLGREMLNLGNEDVLGTQGFDAGEDQPDAPISGQAGWTDIEN